MKKKIIVRTVIVLVVLVLTFLTYCVYDALQELKQEDYLKLEIVNYSNKDLINDEFPIEIKTTGDYAYVEEAIKKYYKSLSDNVKLINNAMNNRDFTTLLSVKNLSSDRPNYIKSHATINDTKTKVDRALKEIESLADESTIKSLLDKDKLSDYEYYYDLYLQLMYTDNDKKEFEQLKKDMKELTKNLDAFFDKADEILVFLEKNDNNLKYTDVINFRSNKEVDEYNKLLTELQDIAKKFDDGSSAPKKEKNKTKDI